jgi:hypothetical protein
VATTLAGGGVFQGPAITPPVDIVGTTENPEIIGNTAVLDVPPGHPFASGVPFGAVSGAVEREGTVRLAPGICLVDE